MKQYHVFDAQGRQAINPLNGKPVVLTAWTRKAALNQAKARGYRGGVVQAISVVGNDMKEAA